MLRFSHIDFESQCELIEDRKGINLDRMPSRDQYEVEKVAISLAKTNLELIFFAPPGRELSEFISAILSGRESTVHYDDSDFLRPDRFSQSIYSTRDYWWILYILMKHNFLSNKIPVPKPSNIQVYITNYVIT